MKKYKHPFLRAYSPDMLFFHDQGTRRFSLLPRRCAISGKSLFLKKYHHILATAYFEGYAIGNAILYVSQEEYVFLSLKYM